MAILCFPVGPTELCIFAIFKPINFKFWILIEKYITTNDTSGFFDKLSISYGIMLELGPSRIKSFGSKNHKNNKLEQKKQNGGENQDGRYNKFS
jgi:hypothetical protein